MAAHPDSPIASDSTPALTPAVTPRAEHRSKGDPRRPLHVALCAGLFLVGLVVTASALQLRDGPPREALIAAKLEHFAAHKDSYRALAVGSSRTFRGIDPAGLSWPASDAKSAGGLFNLGIQGVGWAEGETLLRTALAQQPENLEWVLIEVLNPVSLPGNSGATLPIRVWGHTLPVVQRGLKRSLILHQHGDKRPYGASLGQRWSHGATSVRLGARRLFDYGRGLHLGTEADEYDPLVYASRLRRIAAGSGFEPTEAMPVEDFPQVVRTLLQDPEVTYQEILVGARETLPPYIPLDRRGLLELARIVREAGAKPVFLELPGQLQSLSPGALNFLRDQALVLDFDDPKAYADLFAAEMFFDRTHLNGRGAQRLTRHIAEALAR